MTDRLTERVGERCAEVQARIEELDAEARRTAADCLQLMLARGLAGFSGASRRVLTDRVLERLALQEVLAAREEVIERERETRAKERAHYEREIKPREEAEAKRKRAEEVQRAHDAKIREALDRVKLSRRRREKPDATDVELLRKNVYYTDRYHAPEYIWNLLANMPWWREER